MPRPKRGLVLSLYFGWQLRIFLEKGTEKTFWIFKNYWQYAAIVILMISAVGIGIFFHEYRFAAAETFSWNQSDWSGGTSTIAAVHPTNKLGWTEYYEKDTELSASSTLSLAPIAYTVIQTSDTDFASGTINQTLVVEEGAAAKVSLEELARIDTAISAGDFHSCFLSENGGIYCWGYNNYGQLGNALTSDSSTPVRVLAGAAASGDNDGTHLTNIKSLSGGTDGVTCAISNQKNIYCWGHNNFGQLGNNSTDNSHISVRVAKGQAVEGDNNGTHLTNIASVGNGGNYVCAASASGNLYCWGRNAYGQLGDNSTNDSLTPIRVLKGEAASGDNDGTYLTNIKSVAAGSNYVCAISNQNNVYCWGRNSNGQLGNGLTDDSYVPVRVAYGESVTGDNDGEYLNNVLAITASSNYTCAASNAGNMYCWGYNGNGQLGDGSTNRQVTPIRVLAGAAVGGDTSESYLANIKTVAASSNYTCAASNAGNMYCWGYNFYGQLGNGTTTDSMSPVRALKGAAVSGDTDNDYLANVKSITVGIFDISNYTCALTDLNNIYCWGHNNYGQLGDGTEIDKLTAVRVLGVDGVGYLGGAMPSYVASGDFTSSAINVGLNLNYSNLNFNISKPLNTDIKFQLRTAATEGGLATSTWYGPSGAGDYYTSSATTINSVHNGDAWVQYKAFLSTTDSAVSPMLSDITIGFERYAELASLTSSAYNTTDSSNIIDEIQWVDSLEENTDIKFQLRAAPDVSGGPGEWTGWMGTDGTDASYFTDESGGEAMPAEISNATNDQWVQYKVWLSGDSLHTPTLSAFSMTYIVNTPPEFDPDFPATGNGGAAAVFTSPNEINISYSVRDPDTDRGRAENQYKIWPSFEYSLDNGDSWQIATSTYLGANDMDSKTVATTAYNDYQAVWNPRGQIGEAYSANAKIRVIADDHEGANNTAAAISASFILDTKSPVAASPEGGGTGININHNASTTLNNDKIAATAATLYFSAADESQFQMAVSNTSDFSDPTWESYSQSKSWTLEAGDGSKSVYVKFKDEYGNESGPYSDAIGLDTDSPEIPTGLFIQDISIISNATTTEENASSTQEANTYRLFVSWTKNSESDFMAYEAYKSTNGTDYSLDQTITDVNINYVVGNDLDPETTYYYKFKSKDDVGNPSEFSEPISMVPGSQPNDNVPPAISAVGTQPPTSSSAVITWTTDEVSDSLVLYSADESYSLSRPLSGYVTSHELLLVGLEQGTTYNYKVRSCDPANNCTDSLPATFNTIASDNAPPIIDSVEVSGITDHKVVVSWTTNENAASFVEYSTVNGFALGTIYGQLDSISSHAVVLKPLSANTQYYFKVRSKDGAGNEAISSQGTFTTTNASTTADTTPPAISAVSSSDINYNNATITWTTDEPSSSFVEFGPSGLYGRIYGQEESVTAHAVILPKDLISSSTYHYRVRSVDDAGNEGLSPDGTLTTAASINDVTAPVISSVVIEEPGSTSATIRWITDELSTSYIGFSQDRSYVLEQSSPAMTMSHSITIVGLTPATQYYFRLKSGDPSGNLAIDNNSSQGYSFATAGGSTPPAISGIQIVNVMNNSATINWTTDIGAGSIVEYGFDNAYGKVTGANDSVNSHSVALTGLLSHAAYHFRVRSAAGTEAVSNDLTFTTGAAADTDAPDITDVSVGDITETMARITWLTDKNADSLVDYGTTTSYGLVAGTNSESLTSHNVALINLLSDTKYYFRVKSKDNSGNITIDDNGGLGYSFNTGVDSVFPVISQVETALVNDTSAGVTWTTDELAT
ncbi:MAG: fibronectin type III domain-containing protein, partial [Candidatus Pacebacteria bacterium]|nr:fibronectin type III domain-containing protein [Candidatus Paceibacterota bacterium]